MRIYGHCANHKEKSNYVDRPSAIALFFLSGFSPRVYYNSDGRYRALDEFAAVAAGSEIKLTTIRSWMHAEKMHTKANVQPVSSEHFDEFGI